MNISVVVYFLGWVLNVEAVFMLVPAATAFIYKESEGVYFLITALVCAVLGKIATHRKPADLTFFAKEGFVSVALSWVVLSVFGALPFYFSGEIPSFVDAMFEIISGFTTTGASIVVDVESLARCMLMWRCFTQWIGGMGVLVFLLAFLPLAGGYQMHIMRAESPGPSVGKLVPRVKSTAKILYMIYFFMTVVQIPLLLLGGMPLFDSITLSLGTAATGGFGIKNNSMAFYDSYYLQGVTTVFMILFGINFNVYYLFLFKKPKDALRSEEVRTYLGIIAVAIVLIAWNIRHSFVGWLPAFHHAAFQVASVITTAGYFTVDFDQWPQFSKVLLLLLMLIGSCAGSTSGGIKISRILIMIKTMRKELASLIHPRSIRVLKLGQKVIEPAVIRSVYAYLISYILIFVTSVLLVSLDDFDFVTVLSAVTSAFNNIGPGFGAVGPLCNFSEFSVFSKIVIMFDMLAGRLEIFPMLILCSPPTWRSR